jgi:hypothetical protein
MKAVLMLADYAAVADGKLTIVGGGWSITGPAPHPFGIALKIEVPWDQAEMRHTMRLELLDADGRPVSIPAPNGEQPLVIHGEFAAGRPPELKPGTPLDAVVAINFTPPPPIPPGGRYEWRLYIDDETHEDWRVAFSTRPQAAQPA